MEKSCFLIISQLKIEVQKIQNKALVGDHHLEAGTIQDKESRNQTNEEKIFKCWSKPHISPNKICLNVLLFKNLFLVNMSLILGYG